MENKISLSIFFNLAFDDLNHCTIEKLEKYGGNTLEWFRQ